MSSKQVSALQMLQLLFSEKFTLLGGVAAVFVAELSAMAFPEAAGNLIDVLCNPRSPQSMQEARRLILKLAALIVVGGAGSFAQGSLLEIAGQRVGRTLRKQLFGAIISRPAEFFDSNQSAELSNRLSHDVHEVAEHLVENVAVGLQASIGAVIALVYLFRIAPRLGSLTPLVLPFLSFGAVCYGNVVKKLSMSLLDQLASATQLATERFLQIRTVQAFRRQEDEYKRYAAAIDRSYHLASAVAIAEGGYLAASYVATNGGLLAVLLFGTRLVLRGVMTVGQLSSFLMYTDKLGSSYSSLAEAASGVLKAQGAGARLFSLLELPSAFPSSPSLLTTSDSSIAHTSSSSTSSISTAAPSVSPAVPPPPAVLSAAPNNKTAAATVVFDQVCFEYPSRPGLVLKSVSFCMQPGQVVGLTGPSGSGKSTIALLLQGLYKPQSGSVTIGGMPPFEANPIGWVGQEPALFTGTIRENLLYGCNKAVDEETMFEAARVAQAHAFIQSLPLGYDTIVTEGGMSLSGGQKQRIAFARALVAKPSILILDEITSALDAASEDLVTEAFCGFLKTLPRPSCLIISHRLSLLDLADQIYRLQDGILSINSSHE